MNKVISYRVYIGDDRLWASRKTFADARDLAKRIARDGDTGDVVTVCRSETVVTPIARVYSDGHLSEVDE